MLFVHRPSNIFLSQMPLHRNYPQMSNIKKNTELPKMGISLLAIYFLNLISVLHAHNSHPTRRTSGNSLQHYLFTVI